MNLTAVVNRRKRPEPWAEGEKIPWNDPDFSRRMFKEHLSQEHDAASRRLETIDRQVEWLHREVLSEKPARILDLACGPGLYAQRLAALGHEVTGIDFAPASIAHAKEQARLSKLAIRYEQDDIREAAYPEEQDLVMLISGEVNVFTPADAGGILCKAAESLKPTGTLVLEVHAPEVIPGMGQASRSWCTSKSGLWSDSPHVCLQESFWHPERKVATTRWFVIDAASGEVSVSAASTQDYSDEEYDALFAESGFGSISRFPSLVGAEDEGHRDFAVLVADRQKAPGS